MKKSVSTLSLVLVIILFIGCANQHANKIYDPFDDIKPKTIGIVIHEKSILERSVRIDQFSPSSLFPDVIDKGSLMAYKANSVESKYIGSDKIFRFFQESLESKGYSCKRLFYIYKDNPRPLTDLINEIVHEKSLDGLSDNLWGLDAVLFIDYSPFEQNGKILLYYRYALLDTKYSNMLIRYAGIVASKKPITGNSSLKTIDTLFMKDINNNFPSADYVNQFTVSNEQVSSIKTYSSLEELNTFRDLGTTGPVNAMAVSPDGSIVAGTFNPDTVVVLWDINTGEELKKLSGHSLDVESLAFSPNGKILATGSMDQTIKLWDVETGKVIHSLPGHYQEPEWNPPFMIWKGVVDALSFGPDGSILASGSTDKTVKLWEVKTGELIRTLNGHSDIVNTVVISPDNKILASASKDKTIILWDINTGQRIRTLLGHSEPVNSIAFNSTGTYIATSGGPNIKIWNVDKGIEFFRFSEDNHNSIYSICFTPGDQFLLSGSKDGTVRIWSIDSGTEVTSFILSGHESTVWDKEKQNEDPALAAMFSKGSIVDIVFSNNLIFSGGDMNNQQIKVWRLK